ncbi:MAG: DNA primase [Rhodobiaceae bacterium]|nr:DNA primase [Rhodobiaceae bacterium]MCC0056290.1 DNA primase [Rhodobiaceae bacterium]
MRFTPQFLDDIRARLPVSQVVGKRVKLRRQGREFIGLSPFNQEKSPSFTVNDQKGFYHCFSSGKHGDIFSFVMETEGLSFAEAVERLAGEAGVTLPAPDPAWREREEKRAGLHDVMEMAAAWFQAQLHGQPGLETRAYLQRRGVSGQMVAQFRIGYAPSSKSALKEHLTARGVAVDDMIRAGLLIAGDDIPTPYDRFRDRLMFPIMDLKNRVIAFGGRALSADAKAKYMNSPETPLFHKGDVLFNAYAARVSATDRGVVYVTEGYMDVVAMTAGGFANTVAPLGTALTENQLHLLWRMADEPVLCFDGDNAGLKAAFRAVDTALPLLVPGKSLRFALLPEGRDPDDILRDSGSAALADALSGPRALADMLWAREAETAALDTPERRAAFEARIGAAIRSIKDDTVRRYYGQDMRARINAMLGAQQPQRRERADGSNWRDRAGGGNWRDSRGRGGWRVSDGRAQVQQASERLIRQVRARALPRREALLLMTAINHPGLIADRVEELAAFDFTAPELGAVAARLIDMAMEGTGGDAAGVRAALKGAGQGDLLNRLDSVAADAGDWFVRPDADEADALIGFDHILALHHRQVTLHKELKAAEDSFRADPSETNWERIVELRNALAGTSGSEVEVEGFGLASRHVRR